MSLDRVRIGFLPLVDAALPILAHEQGFAAAEGVRIELVRDLTWATVRDRLLYGHTDAAHLIAPLAIATSLGRGRPAVSLSVPFVLGLNGNAVTLSTALAAAVELGGAWDEAWEATSKRLRPDKKVLEAEEKRRFELLEDHWDIIVSSFDPAPSTP